MALYLLKLLFQGMSGLKVLTTQGPQSVLADTLDQVQLYCPKVVPWVAVASESQCMAPSLEEMVNEHVLGNDLWQRLLLLLLGHWEAHLHAKGPDSELQSTVESFLLPAHPVGMCQRPKDQVQLPLSHPHWMSLARLDSVVMLTMAVVVDPTVSASGQEW